MPTLDLFRAKSITRGKRPRRPCPSSRSGTLVSAAEGRERRVQNRRESRMKKECSRSFPYVLKSFGTEEIAMNGEGLGRSVYCFRAHESSAAHFTKMKTRSSVRTCTRDLSARYCCLGACPLLGVVWPVPCARLMLQVVVVVLLRILLLATFTKLFLTKCYDY